MLFNLIQLINFWFDLILLCGTYDITSISISISIISSFSNSISTQPVSSAEVENVWRYSSTFRLCLNGIYATTLLLLLLLELQLATLLR
jgi:hypothetical protein